MAGMIEQPHAVVPARLPGGLAGGPAPRLYRLGAFVRRHKLAPYLLLTPALIPRGQDAFAH